ncbi:hypothetical protein [Marivirga sp.]|uniref:hypothetical protein n=1 Tax=Marivirga sp. TaxID=2018662 RepID=UPI0025EE5EEC|nr:hypothetical protein [Marivirga sp.]
MEELRFNSSSSNVFKIGDSKNAILSSLGQPDSDEYFYFEMSAKEGRLLKYSQNRILLKQDKFYTLTIKDGSIEIGRSENYFKVGDTVDKLYNAFPEFSSKPVSNGYINIPLRSIDYDMECTRLIITLQNNQIVKIMRHDC